MWSSWRGRILFGVFFGGSCLDGREVSAVMVTPEIRARKRLSLPRKTSHVEPKLEEADRQLKVSVIIWVLRESSFRLFSSSHEITYVLWVLSGKSLTFCSAPVEIKWLILWRRSTVKKSWRPRTFGRCCAWATCYISVHTWIEVSNRSSKANQLMLVDQKRYSRWP